MTAFYKWYFYINIDHVYAKIQLMTQSSNFIEIVNNLGYFLSASIVLWFFNVIVWYFKI